MLAMRAVVTGLVVLCAVGCSTTTFIVREPVEHIVMMNSTGKVVEPSGNVACRAGYDVPCDGQHSIRKGYRELSNFGTVEYARRIVDELEAYQKAGNRRRILIYIHGGLNSGVGAIKRAAELSDEIEAAGYYPIFVNWNSALLSSYREHVVYIRQGEHWGGNPFSLSLIPFYFGADLARSVAKAPVAWFQMVRSDRESRPRSSKSRMAKEEAERMAAGDPSEATIKIQQGFDRRTARERGWAVTGYIGTVPTKLLSVPIIDGFGANAWETLIRRARVLFHTDEEMSISRVKYRSLDPSSNGKLQPLGGLSIFLRQLSQFLARDDQKNWEITIIGHSMGAIVANEIIRNYAEGPNAREGSLPIENVVYLAAAASLRDYEDTIFPFLAQKKTRRMYHLTLHRAAEVRDTVSKVRIGPFDLAPRGSLLVWIDNYLSRPNIPLDRTAGRFVNLMTEVHDTPKGIADRISIREFDAGNAVADTQPQHHGDFGRIKFWIPQCWEPQTPYAKDGCYPSAPKKVIEE